MRRFFTYQYGKVGSTSLVEALNKLPDAEAYQSLFLGEAASSDTLTRLMNPEVPDYFFHPGTSGPGWPKSSDSAGARCLPAETG